MDIGSLLFSLCCGCWVIPLVIVGIVYGLSQSVRYAWSSRGVEPDGMYCAQCRFDVRGATSEDCPECGAYLLHAPEFGSPCGGILVKDVDPPMGLAIRLLVYLLAGFAPAVAAVVFFGMLLPINYLHNTWVELSVKNHPNLYTEINLSIDARRSWIGNKRLDELSCWQADDAALDQFNTADPRDIAAAQAVWDSIWAEQGFVLSEADQAALRDEFAAVLLAACEFDEKKARSELKQFQMDWYSYSKSSFHGLYILFGFFAVIAALIVISIRAQRDHGAIHAEFYQKIERVQSRYREMLADNHKTE